jgi:YidC/Oxa1 family membrane protein insertase
MNIKDFILPLALALLGAWAVQHFIITPWFGGPLKGAATSFEVPVSQEACKPLNMEVDFIDNEESDKIAQLTIVDTQWGQAVFSTAGASLEQLIFKRTIDGQKQLISTISSSSKVEREERCFLAAFQDKTPYNYRLIEHRERSDNVIIVYQADSPHGTINKSFIVYKELNKVDVTVSVSPKNGPAQVRLFYTAPHMTVPVTSTQDPQKYLADDVISAVVIDNAESFVKINKKDISFQKGWITPALFGAESRYFVHALITDQHHGAQRAYYKMGPDNQLMAVIESPLIEKPTSWTYSFFMGPKESSAVMPVDRRLEKTFEYSGILAPISYGILSFLNFLYDYIKSYGLAIIILTLLIKLLLLPISIRGEQGMKQRVELQKKMAYLKQKHKDNREALAREQGELIRKHGLPGMSGFLGLFIQMPIFFALSRVLSSSIEFFHAPMLWVPDLSAKDPYYILPALVTISMLTQASTVEKQQRFSMIALALVFGAFTASLSAGLALYFCASTFLGVMQVYLLKYFNIVK